MLRGIVPQHDDVRKIIPRFFDYAKHDDAQGPLIPSAAEGRENKCFAFAHAVERD